MRKVIYSMNVSLDGFTQTLDGNIDWVVADEEIHTFWTAQVRKQSLFIYGRRMYETMSPWPRLGKDPSTPPYMLEFARIWERTPKVVFSKTLKEVSGNSSLVADENISAAVNQLKALPGNDMGVGGATLAASFIKLGLVDEYQLCIYPVILGAGTPFFPKLDHKLKLQLAETRTFRSGVVYVRYQENH